jgi:hypothetical protein
MLMCLITDVARDGHLARESEITGKKFKDQIHKLIRSNFTSTKASAMFIAHAYIFKAFESRCAMESAAIEWLPPLSLPI